MRLLHATCCRTPRARTHVKAPGRLSEHATTPVRSRRSHARIEATSVGSPHCPFVVGAPLHPRDTPSTDRGGLQALRHTARRLQSSPPLLLAPPRDAAPRSSPTSRHFLLPRGHLSDGSLLWQPSEHSVTAMSFDSSSRRSPTTSPAPSTNGPPHHHRSPAAQVTPPWMAPAGEAPTTPTPIVDSPHLHGPPGPLSGSHRHRHGRSGRVATGATMGARSPALAGPQGQMGQ
jgi:hypothetical protein